MAIQQKLSLMIPGPTPVPEKVLQALSKLVGLPFKNYELIKIPNEKTEIKIEIHSVGLLKDDSHALGITFAKSGQTCLLYTSPSPRDKRQSRMPSSA